MKTKRNLYQSIRKIITRRKKRTTFGKMILKATIGAILLTVAFGAWFFYDTMKEIEEKANEQLLVNVQMLEKQIVDAPVTNGYQNYLLPKGTGAEINYDNAKYPISCFNYYFNYHNTDGSFSASALVDENGNIVVTSKEVMDVTVRGASAYCVLTSHKYPQMENFNELYNEIKDSIEFSLIEDRLVSLYYIYLNSIYYDSKTSEFIPKEGYFLLLEKANFSDADDANYSINGRRYRPKYTEQFTVDIDESRFEIVEACNFLDSLNSLNVPILCFGTSEEDFQRAEPILTGKEQEKDISTDNRFEFTIMASTPVTIEGNEYSLRVLYHINPITNGTIFYMTVSTVALFAVLMILSLLLCWRQNLINKSRYEREDYQRALTNNLAHDLKTPLMAIGGYAENLLDMYRNGHLENTDEYLSAILSNVSYTDSLIMKTLDLNRVSDTFELKFEEVEVEKIVDKAIEKYRLRLDKNSIQISLNGNAKISADAGRFSMAVENLISNAVKYTKRDGKISVWIDKMGLIIKNDVENDISTKNLTDAFVMGDNARSGKSGNGLGLSIAKSSLEALGFKLLVSCQDKVFKCEIEYK